MMTHCNRRHFCTACATLLLGACADVKMPSSLSSLTGGGDTSKNDASKNATTLDTVGTLPPPPSRTWPDPKLDLDNARADGWGLVASPDMEQYLNALLATIKKTAGTPSHPGSVHIIGDPSLNANSSPGGNIFVSMGWLQMAESEDEIFAILSHEFGHIYLNHHAIYDARTAGNTTVELVSFAWAIANKTPAANTWSGIDNVAVVQTLGTRVLFPAWQRSVEEQADRFGATISLRCGYSYADGFKAFLERVATYDQQAKARRRALRDQQAQVARTKATQSAATKSQTQTLVPGLGVSPSQLSNLGGLSDVVATYTASRADAQSEVAGNMFDVQQMIENQIADQMETLHDDHGDPTAREESLRALVRPLIGSTVPDAKVGPWNAVRQRGDTAQQIAHYGAVGDLQGLQASGQYTQAVTLAQTIASGSTANDALPVFMLVNAMALSGARQPDSQLQILKRNLSSRERSWQIQTNVASRLAARDARQGESFLLEQFDYFGKASATWPGVIAFYRERGNTQRAKDLAQTCSVNYPGMRPACLAASTTPAQQKTANDDGVDHAKKLIPTEWLNKILPKGLGQ